MAYPLEYGDSPDTAAFIAINRPRRLGYVNVVARDAADNRIGSLRNLGDNLYAAEGIEFNTITSEEAYVVFARWSRTPGYRLQVI